MRSRAWKAHNSTTNIMVSNVKNFLLLSYVTSWYNNNYNNNNNDNLSMRQQQKCTVSYELNNNICITILSLSYPIFITYSLYIDRYICCNISSK